MSNIRYLNQSAPFWDWVASLEDYYIKERYNNDNDNQAESSSTGASRNARNRDGDKEKEKEREKEKDKDNEADPPPVYSDEDMVDDTNDNNNGDAPNEKTPLTPGDGEAPEDPSHPPPPPHERGPHGHCGRGGFAGRGGPGGRFRGGGGGGCGPGGPGSWRARHGHGPWGSGWWGGRHGGPGGFGFGAGFPFGPAGHHGPPHHHHHHRHGPPPPQPYPAGGPGGFFPPGGVNLEPLFDFARAMRDSLNGGNAGGNWRSSSSRRPAGPDGASRDFSPAVDVFDTPDAFVVHASLPGARKEDLGVSWDPEASELALAGVVHRPDADEELLKSLALDERDVGAFERRVRLGAARGAAGGGAGAGAVRPASVDADNISARMQDGVLIVRVPKVEEFVEIRKVDVE